MTAVATPTYRMATAGHLGTAFTSKTAILATNMQKAILVVHTSNTTAAQTGEKCLPGQIKTSGVATIEAVRQLPRRKFGSIISDVLKLRKHCLISLYYNNRSRMKVNIL